MVRFYSEAVSVALTGAQHAALDRLARERGIGIAALMRDSALRRIGRGDLVSEQRERREHGLEVENPAPDRQFDHRALVRLTKAQRRALSSAARKRGLALSALLRDPACRAADAPSPKPAPGAGRPAGSRAGIPKRGQRVNPRNPTQIRPGKST